MRKSIAKFLLIATLVVAPVVSSAQLLNFVNTKSWRQSGPETMFYLGGRTDMFFQDGFWEIAPCIFNQGASIVVPNEFCPLGTTGFIAQGDIDGDGVNDQGAFWSVASITPASVVEPFRADLFRLISAPPSGFTRLLRSTDGDVSAIFDVLDASVIVWYDTLQSTIDDYEASIYAAVREYGAGPDELERHYDDVPWGPYKFGLPALVPPSSTAEPGQVVYGVDHIVTPDAWPGRGVVSQGWRNSNLEDWGDNGELELDPRVFYPFQWSGLSPANTLQSDVLTFSLNANQFINPEGVTETKYSEGILGRGTVTGLSCFNTITTDLNLDEVLEQGKIYELVFTSGQLPGTELATQYPITIFGDSGGLSVFRVVTRDEGYTWAQARELANAAGGRLAVLDSQTKRDFVNTQLVGAGFDTVDGEWPSMWIGLSDSEEEGEWRWINGQALPQEPPIAQDIGNVADAFTPFELNTFGSVIDTELGLYDIEGNLLQTNDDAGAAVQSQLDFPEGLGEGIYFLAVGTWDSAFNNGFDVTLGGPGGPYELTHPNGVEIGELGPAGFDWYRLEVGSPAGSDFWEEGAPTLDPPENEFDFAHILGGVAADGSAPVWFDEEGTVALEAFLLEIPIVASNEIVLPGASDLTAGVVTGNISSGAGFDLVTNRPLGEPNCLQTGQTYRLEITSGELAGTTQFPITTWEEFTLTTIGDDPLPFDLAGVPSLAPGDTFVLTPENVNTTFSIGYMGRHFIEASDALSAPADFSTLVRGSDYRIEFLTGELAGTSDTIRNWGFPTNSYLETESDFFGQLAVGDTFKINLIELPPISVAIGDEFVIGQIFEDWIQDKYDAEEVLSVDGGTLSSPPELGGFGIPATPDLIVDQGFLGPLYAVARPDTFVFPPYPIEVGAGDRSAFIVGTLDNMYQLGPFFFNPGDSVDATLDLSRASVSSPSTVDVGNYDLSFRVQFIDTYEGFALLGGLGDDTGFPFATPSSERDPDYDFDRDGASNLLEYALGSNVADPNDRPAFLYALDEQAGSCTATLTKRPFTGSSVEYYFEYSTDLRTWTTIGDNDPIFEIVVDNDENLQVTNLSNFPNELATPACFLRVRVEIVR